MFETYSTHRCIPSLLCAVSQTLLDALAARNPFLCTDLCRAIAEPSGDGEAASTSAPFARLMQDRVGSHLAEKVRLFQSRTEAQWCFFIAIA
jgi:hypothetical protein